MAHIGDLLTLLGVILAFPAWHRGRLVAPRPTPQDSDLTSMVNT
jgi:hypothetical protein